MNRSARLVVIPGQAQDSGAEHGGPLATAAAAALALVPGASLAFGGFYDLTAWAWLALLVYTLLVALLMRRQLPGSRASLAVLGAAATFTAWAALSALWAPAVGRVWTEANMLGLYTAALAVLVIALRSERVVRLSWSLLGISLGALCVWGAVALLVGGGGGAFTDFRLQGPIGYINGTASLLLMAFWIVLSYGEGGSRWWLRGLAVGCAGLALDLLVLTQSRAVLPALLLAVVAVLAVAPNRQERIALVVLVAAGVAAALPWLLDVYASRPASGADGAPPAHVVRHAALAALLSAGATAGLAVIAIRQTERSATARRAARLLVTGILVVAVVAGGLRAGDIAHDARRAWADFTSLRPPQDRTNRFIQGGGYRYDLWRVAVDQFRRQPLNGVGAGNYDSTFFRERRTAPFVRQPHSVELQALGELGIPGGLLLVVVVAIVAIAGARLPSRRPELAAVAPAAIGVATAWLVQASVDWIHLLPGVTVIALISAATLLSDRPVSSADDAAVAAHRSLVIRRVMIASAIGLAAVGAASVGRQLAAATYLDRAERHLPTAPGAARRDASRSAGLNRFEPRVWYVLAASYARRDDYGHARQALEEAAAAEPFNYVPWALMGDLDTRKGYLKRARLDYARAHRLDPFDPPIRP